MDRLSYRRRGTRPAHHPDLRASANRHDRVCAATGLAGRAHRLGWIIRRQGDPAHPPAGRGAHGRRRAIVVRHILRNALIPVVTSLGLIANALIHGSVFLDRMFSLPGFGSLVVNGIQLLDFPVILGTTIFSALIVIAANLITDVIYPFIDPRVRIE
ncbi:MAG: ABC transporter permease [Chloroflexi bacterium]|nr:MAG: ABC transporter permease [Chloroflexota bacterium]